MLISVLGYLILMGMTVILFSLSFYQAFGVQELVSLGVIKMLILLGLLYGVKDEWVLSLIEEKKESFSFNLEDLINFFSVFGGTIITFYISMDMGQGPVVAASIVAIAFTLIIPKYDVPAYCGAFVGMACNSLLITYYHISLAGIIAGAVFVVSKHVFNGFGGKLGTIAFTGCVFSSLLTGEELASASIPEWNVGRYLIIYSVLGAVLTFIINVRFNHSAVISSGVVGLYGGLLLPVIYPQLGEMLGVMVICASFAGMSSGERLSNEIHMVIAGIFCALIFMYTSPYFGGAGGKLGTIAFGSVISLRGIIDINQMLQERVMSYITPKKGRNVS